MKLVRHLLDVKGHDVISIAPDASVLDAIRRMAERSVGALLVMERDELLGIVTERDYARKVILKGRLSDDTAVRDIMSTDMATTCSEDNVQHCMNLMTDKRIRHLPVIDDGRVTGIISIGDLVKAIIDDQQHEIEQLGQYISG
ncbi:MAG TPA: CBS domain-containing protein [Woeseiaceae bacterium]|nr:CBS domain-containing protein [Woeseiaceae bacterium]